MNAPKTSSRQEALRLARTMLAEKTPEHRADGPEEVMARALLDLEEQLETKERELREAWAQRDAAVDALAGRPPRAPNPAKESL